MGFREIDGEEFFVVSCISYFLSIALYLYHIFWIGIVSIPSPYNSWIAIFDQVVSLCKSRFSSCFMLKTCFRSVLDVLIWFPNIWNPRDTSNDVKNLKKVASQTRCDKLFFPDDWSFLHKEQVCSFMSEKTGRSFHATGRFFFHVENI